MSNKGMYAQTAIAENDAYKDGIEINYGSFRVWLTHAGRTNREYRKTLKRVAGAYYPALQSGSLPEERQEQILMDAFAQGCVKRWEVNAQALDSEEIITPSEQGDIPTEAWKAGIEDSNGDIVSFTAQNVYKVFKDRETLFWELYDISQDLSNYRVAAREGAAKN